MVGDASNKRRYSFLMTNSPFPPSLPLSLLPFLPPDRLDC
jgi:hypothetical protein